jgi:thioredoxin reductase (NADPH)
LPGIFAVGDVRSGSIKRVASAVGEGSVVVAEIHRYLSELKGAGFASTRSQHSN